LASKFAESGGEYLFLARSVHPAAGVTAGVVSLLAGFTGPIAAAAMGLEIYLRPLASFLEPVPQGGIAITAIALAAALHCLPVGKAVRVQDAVVLLKLFLIAGFIAFAVLHWPQLTFPSDETISVPLESPQTTASFITTFANQLVWISFSLAGFNAAIYVAGEVRNPSRNVPVAMIGGTILVSILYVILNAIFVYSSPQSVITDPANISQIAATSATAIGGNHWNMFVRVVIVVALMTSVSAMLMTGPRVYCKMADDGFLPSFFRFSGRPPAMAIAFQATLSCVVVLFSSLQGLLGYLGLTLSLCSALTIASLFHLRRRGRIDRLPGFGIPPAVFVVVTITLGLLSSWEKPLPMVAALLTLIVGLVLYRVTRKPNNDAA
jgi:APA family basic amino acid/polyamine antiporter